MNRLIKRSLVLGAMSFSLLALSGCDLINKIKGLGVTPFAYVTYKTEGTQYAYYDNTMYGSTHIFVFEQESDMPNAEDPEYNDNRQRYLTDCSLAAAINIRFQKILGVEEVNGEKATLVELGSWYLVEVTVYNSTATYSEAKSVYLNGEKLTVKSDKDEIKDTEYIRMFHFEDCGLKRSNPDGQIDGTVNYLEYK